MMQYQSIIAIKFSRLNELERNLRKLLFNVYIVNFGVDYFNTTINGDIQSDVKQYKL